MNVNMIHNRIAFAAALAALGVALPSGPTSRAEPNDPDTLRRAQMKRARKNAKRVGAVTLPAADAVDIVELPK
jgi:hypothetical protein